MITKQELRKTVGEIETATGPLKWRDIEPVTITRDQLRILIEAARDNTVFTTETVRGTIRTGLYD